MTLQVLLGRRQQPPTPACCGVLPSATGSSLNWRLFAPPWFPALTPSPVAARDSVVSLGGPTWTVQSGRRDSATPSLSNANNDLPYLFTDLAALTSTFSDKGFTSKEMVALLGAHTIGQARCKTFQNRFYQETNISSAFEISLQWNCLRTGSDENVSPLDTISPVTFDNAYCKDLVNNKVLLHYDQQLYNNGSTKTQAAAYRTKSATFHADFAATMLKMGNLCPLTGLMARFEQIAEK